MCVSAPRAGRVPRVPYLTVSPSVGPTARAQPPIRVTVMWITTKTDWHVLLMCQSARPAASTELVLPMTSVSALPATTVRRASSGTAMQFSPRADLCVVETVTVICPMCAHVMWAGPAMGA